MTDYPRNPATALGAAVARLSDRQMKDIRDCVNRGLTQLTETQETQLRVIVGMYMRDAAAQGRWYERQRHNLGVATTVISPRQVIRETQPHAPKRTTDENPRYPDDAPTMPMRKPLPDVGDE